MLIAMILKSRQIILTTMIMVLVISIMILMVLLMINRRTSGGWNKRTPRIPIFRAKIGIRGVRNPLRPWRDDCDVDGDGWKKRTPTYLQSEDRYSRCSEPPRGRRCFRMWFAALLPVTCCCRCSCCCCSFFSRNMSRRPSPFQKTAFWNRLGCWIAFCSGS